MTSAACLLQRNVPCQENKQLSSPRTSKDTSCPLNPPKYPLLPYCPLNPPKCPLTPPVLCPLNPPKCPLNQPPLCPLNPLKCPLTPPPSCPLDPPKCPLSSPPPCPLNPPKCPLTPPPPCPLNPPKCPLTPPSSCPLTPPLSCPLNPPKPCPLTPPSSCPLNPPTPCPLTPPSSCPLNPPTPCPLNPPKCPLTPPPSCPLNPTKCPLTPSPTCPLNPPPSYPLNPPKCPLNPSLCCPLNIPKCPFNPPPSCSLNPPKCPKGQSQSSPLNSSKCPFSQPVRPIKPAKCVFAPPPCFKDWHDLYPDNDLESYTIDDLNDELDSIEMLLKEIYEPQCSEVIDDDVLGPDCPFLTKAKKTKSSPCEKDECALSLPRCCEACTFVTPKSVKNSSNTLESNKPALPLFHMPSCPLAQLPCPLHPEGKGDSCPFFPQPCPLSDTMSCTLEHTCKRSEPNLRAEKESKNRSEERVKKHLQEELVKNIEARNINTDNKIIEGDRCKCKVRPSEELNESLNKQIESCLGEVKGCPLACSPPCAMCPRNPPCPIAGCCKARAPPSEPTPKVQIIQWTRPSSTTQTVTPKNPSTMQPYSQRNCALPCCPNSAPPPCYCKAMAPTPAAFNSTLSQTPSPEKLEKLMKKKSRQSEHLPATPSLGTSDPLPCPGAYEVIPSANLNCGLKTESCSMFPEGRCPGVDLNLCDCDYPLPPCMQPLICAERDLPDPQYCIRLDCCMGLPPPPTVKSKTLTEMKAITFDKDGVPIIKVNKFYKFCDTKPGKEDTKYYVDIFDEKPEDEESDFYSSGQRKLFPFSTVIEHGKAYEKCKFVAEKLSKRPPCQNVKVQYDKLDCPMDPLEHKAMASLNSQRVNIDD